MCRSRSVETGCFRPIADVHYWLHPAPCRQSLAGVYQWAAASACTCFCLWGMKGVSSVPKAIETQSANSPCDRDQNKVEPHSMQNSRTTFCEEA